MLPVISGIFGTINPPPQLAAGYGTVENGLALFIGNILKLISLVAGLFAVLNFILSGYAIMSSEGDPEKMTKATAKIWNSVLGLAIIVLSFAFAALLGWILFKDPGAILNLQVYGPGS